MDWFLFTRPRSRQQINIKYHGNWVGSPTSFRSSHAVVERRSSDRLFSHLSLNVLNVDGQAVLACLQRLVLLAGRIYDHLHATHRTGRESGFIGFPFYGLDAVGLARARTSATVSAEKNGIELCRTDRCTRWRSLSDCDKFESQRLTR
jgi:hypothetical protein